MEENNSLLIIGNGFDLNAGLDSSFSQFYNKTYKNIDVKIDEINEIVKTSKDSALRNLFNNIEGLEESINSMLDEDNFNFWIAYILLQRKIPKITVENWSDIENTLSSFFEDRDASVVNILSNIIDFYSCGNNTLNDIRGLLNTHLKNISYTDSNDDVYIYILSIKLIMNHLSTSQKEAYKDFASFMNSIWLTSTPSISFTIDDYNNYRKNISHKEKSILSKFKDELIKYLRIELRNFEIDLNNYLLNEVSNCDKYEETTKTQISKMAENNNYSLLNFNYTHHSLDGNICRAQNNIHGKLSDSFERKDYNDNIIIGIDGENVNQSGPEYQFTKTFRVITQEDTEISTFENILSKSIKKIIFYGHSFSHSDYSYFENIFDFYHIEDITTDLILCYSIHSGKSDDQIKSEQLRNFSKLIDNYCQKKPISGDSLLKMLLLNKKINLKKI